MNMCPLCSRPLKTGMKLKKKSDMQNKDRGSLKLDEEMWIHISSLIHAAKQIQSWTLSKRTSTVLENLKDLIEWKILRGDPVRAWEVFQHS